jgi:beta-lactam-binding protein with PASTA domain
VIRRFPSNNAAHLSRAERVARQAAQQGGPGVMRRILGGAAQGLGTLLDLWAIGQAGAEGASLLGADDEDFDARNQAKIMRQRLENALRKVLDDPKNQPRIIPRDFSGKPDDLPSLIGTMNNNLANGRRPFDGILTDPDTTVPPEAQKGLRPALDAARGLITQGRVLKLAVKNAEKDAARHDAQARAKLADAVTMARLQQPHYLQLAQLPAAAADVRARTAALKSQTASLQAAHQALRDAAGKAEQNANTICDFARRAASATEDEVNAWRSQAQALMNQSAGALDAAQRQIDGAAVSTNELRASMDRLEAFQDTIALLPAPSAVSDALAAARAAVNAAGQQRAPIAAWVQEIQTIPAKVKALLEPYSWDEEVPIVIAQAETLGAGLTPPDPVLNMDHLMTGATEVVDAFLAWATTAEQSLRTTDIAALLSDAAAAQREVAALPADAAPRPAIYTPLQQAQQCYAEIKFDAQPAAGVAGQEAPPPAQPPAKTTVPTVLLLPEDQARAVLSGAGFKVARTDASTRTPSEKEAGAVQRQDPNAGEDAEVGSTVTLTVYRKFGEEPPALPDPTDPTKVRVRSVLTLTPAEARAVLQGDGLRVAFAPTKITTPRKEQEFTIQRQDPAGGAVVVKGAVVTLTVYGPHTEDSGSTPSETPVAKDRVPDVRGLTQAQAIDKLAEWGLTVGGIDVSGQPPEGKKPNTVHTTIPSAGEKVPADKRVALKLYGDSGTSAATASTPQTVDAAGAPTGKDEDLIGRWLGDWRGFDGQRVNEVITISKRGQAWNLSVSTNAFGELELSSLPGAKTTVEGGKLRCQFSLDDAAVDFHLTVHGDVLKGYYTFTRGGTSDKRVIQGKRLP